jgi:hypothetical protein
MTDQMDLPTAKVPPPPTYVPPPIIYRRPPRPKPIFDAPIPRDPERSAAANIGIAVACLAAVSLAALFVLFVAGTMMSNEDHANGKFTRYELEHQAHVPFRALSAEPDANQYRDEQWHGDVFCGEVNIKNSSGGYNGWIPFSSDTHDAKPGVGGVKAVYGTMHWGWAQVDSRCGPMQP